MAVIFKMENAMRRISLLVLALAAAHAYAAGSTDKDSLVNTRYKESAAEKNAREFKEADIPLPAFPDPARGNWFDIYVDRNYEKSPKILTDSIEIAPDRSIRYVLNVKSAQGYDNLSAEGLFCADTSFSSGNSKRSSYKVFGYGDTVNKRWISPRNGTWKDIGSTMSRNDALHTVIYKTFCEDGVPSSVDALRARLTQRAGRYSPSLTNRDK